MGTEQRYRFPSKLQHDGIGPQCRSLRVGCREGGGDWRGLSGVGNGRKRPIAVTSLKSDANPDASRTSHKGRAQVFLSFDRMTCFSPRSGRNGMMLVWSLSLQL